MPCTEGLQCQIEEKVKEEEEILFQNKQFFVFVAFMSLVDGKKKVNVKKSCNFEE